MENKKILKDAVAKLGKYSPNHIKVFNVLVDHSVEGKVFLPVKEIQEISNMKRSSIYFALNSLQNDGIIAKDKTQMGAFVFQEDKIGFLIASYKTKQKLSV
jgi:predicted transcriptional regulator